jgi:hypothetical protein
LWFYSAISLGFVFIPLLFPTGRLLSPRWRPIAVLAAATTTAIVVLSALKPTLTLQTAGSSIDNPIGIAGVPDADHSRLGDGLIGLFTILTGVAALSLVVRFRRPHGVQRQQLKWFTYAAVLTFLWLLLGDYLLPNAAVLGMLFGVIYSLIPVAAGVAILRYRLYDIGRLINRTLVYGLLTAVLASVYAGRTVKSIRSQYSPATTTGRSSRVHADGVRRKMPTLTRSIRAPSRQLPSGICCASSDSFPVFS